MPCDGACIDCGELNDFFLTSILVVIHGHNIIVYNITIKKSSLRFLGGFFGVFFGFFFEFAIMK